MSNQQKLHEHILCLSQSDDWEHARSEWRLYQIYHSETSLTCPCGQYPINEICVIVNQFTNVTTEVGNVCVNNFLQIASNDLFKSVRYVREDAGRSFNVAMIEYAHQQRFINDWEYKFYNDIRRKRALTGRQKEKKIQVNEKILKCITR
ncbi:conserved hypothetical protein [Planctopirus limnophila DSM 3776]|uniref:Uncharacterized protein n=1 Tax=Planctopirus limnophila (strain ATCC 43296 / DSM 3776 / IFAM 1008 / Mu 290) TaxID=521674 RepID=D5SMM8_PLAL2|nr:conserved hypothetical protein [Planctopirus limnophila DSM 3776]